MASNSTLLTKRTIGASSTSSRPTSLPPSSSPPETSSDSRSTPSSSLRLGIAVSTCSMALSSSFCSLSSSTTMASTPRPHWNLISSIACRLVGSETPRNNRLPRLNKGSTRCLASSLSETARTASRSILSELRSNSGTPYSVEAAMAMSRALTAPPSTSWVTKLVFFSMAACSAACIPDSSTMPSCTSRWGKPPRLDRDELMAKEALSFMYLAHHPGAYGIRLVYLSRQVDQCQISPGCLHIGTMGCVTGFPKEQAPPKRGFVDTSDRRSDQVWQEVGRYAALIFVAVGGPAVVIVAGIAAVPQTQMMSKFASSPGESVRMLVVGILAFACEPPYAILIWPPGAVALTV